MKRVCTLLMFGFIALSLSGNAQAIPAFKKHFDKTYVKDSKDEKFVEAAKAAKCNLCHYGKSKKNRNDYGMALSKYLKKNDFKASRIKAEPDKTAKEMKEGFEKAEKDKSKGGMTFGALIKAGKLPGTAPEAEAKK